MRIAMKKSLLVLAAGLAAQGVSGAAAHAFIIRGAGTLAILSLLAGSVVGIRPARAQTPTSISALSTPGCVNAQRPKCFFNATQWGNMPTGLEFEDLLLSASAFPAPDPLTGSGNGFFGASQYAYDCNTSLMIIDTPAEPAVGQFPAQAAVVVPLCQATSVPVVDASFLNQLSGAGMQFHLVFPIQDNGNQRGYVVWNSPLSSAQAHAGATYPAVEGFARIEGVTWQNQFQPTTISFGDFAGEFINDQPSPTRESTLRLEVPGWSATLGTSFPVTYGDNLSDELLPGAKK
jgi:hypothetical protein